MIIPFVLYLLELINYNPGSDASTFQNFLLCLEMLIASALHSYFFPVEEWDQDYANKKKFEKLTAEEVLIRIYFLLSICCFSPYIIYLRP